MPKNEFAKKKKNKSIKKNQGKKLESTRVHSTNLLLKIEIRIT